MNAPDPARRPDVRRALQRDASRLARREVGHRSFWNSLGVLGMIGWPIALASVGGAVLGRYIDMQIQSGVRFTLLFLMIGAGMGSWIAWKAIRLPAL